MSPLKVALKFMVALWSCKLHILNLIKWTAAITIHELPIAIFSQINLTFALWTISEKHNMPVSS